MPRQHKGPHLIKRKPRRDTEGRITHQGCYLIKDGEYQGRPVTVRKGFYTLKNKVFDKERSTEVNRHTFRHTCATWLVQAGLSYELVAKYLSTTAKIIEDVYGHFHPNFQSEADDAFSKGKAGRGKEGRLKKAA